MCGTVAFAKVVEPDPGNLHPSVFQFGPQGFGLARYPDDTARPDRQEITRQPVGILFGMGMMAAPIRLLNNSMNPTSSSVLV